MSSPAKKNRDRPKDAAREPPHGAATSRWEWVTAGLGLLLVLGTVAYIGHEALTTAPLVPDVTLEHIRTEPTSGGHVVKFRAHNAGPSTAAGLSIIGELLDGAQVVEESEIVLDYLPAHGERLGGLIFRNDPARYDLRLEAQGYVDP